MYIVHAGSTKFMSFTRLASFTPFASSTFVRAYLPPLVSLSADIGHTQRCGHGSVFTVHQLGYTNQYWSIISTDLDTSCVLNISYKGFSKQEFKEFSCNQANSFPPHPFEQAESIFSNLQHNYWPKTRRILILNRKLIAQICLYIEVAILFFSVVCIE